MFAIAHFRAREQFIQGAFNASQGLTQALGLGLGVFGHQAADGHARLVQNRHADADTGIQAHALDPHGQHGIAVHRHQFIALDQLARSDQFGDDHGHGFEGFDFLVRVMTHGAVLHEQHADHAAATDDGHAHQRVIDFFAGFRAIGEIGVGLGVGQGQGAGMGGNIAHQTFTHTQTCLVYRGLFQTLGREQFQYFTGAQDVARAHFGHHVGSNQVHDLVQPFLGHSAPRHHIAKAGEQAARHRRRRRNHY